MVIIIRSIRDFFKDGGMTFAAALSFYTVTAIVPLSLFLVTIFGYVLGGHAEIFDFIVEKFMDQFPQNITGFTNELKKLVTFKGIGKMSLALYGLLSFQLYSAINKALEVVFKVQKERSFIGSVFFSFIVVALLVIIIFASFTLASALPIINILRKYFPWIQTGIITRLLINFVIPLMLVQSTMTILYLIVPKKKVRMRDALWGGTFTAVMLEAAKHFFAWYMGSVVKLGTIYGSLTAFIMFLTWVFYSSVIFLVGGELVHNLGKDRAS